ncbi:MAG: GH1 family beta-glucosidase [Ilumatobacter sp.]
MTHSSRSNASAFMPAGVPAAQLRRQAAVAGTPLRFPADFVWGSATSSFQIEGSPDLDGKSPSIWDVFCATPGNIRDGSDGRRSCDHVNRVTDDVALMADLGLDVYRFSVAWTRVIPDGTGEINHAGLDFYDRLVDHLLDAGITPMPTLYHWDLPQTLDERGGWLARDTAHAFADYSQAVVQRLGDRVGTWTTLNEPFVSANHGYVTGEHAPGHAALHEGFTASHHLLLAHGLATERIRSIDANAEVAIVLNFTPVEAATDDPGDQERAAMRDDIENRWYVDPIGGFGYPESTADALGWARTEVHDGDMDLIASPIDLLGINFYSRQVVRHSDRVESDIDDDHLPEFATTAMGWEIHPPSLGRLLRWLDDRFVFPKLMITENGCAMPDDRHVDNAHGSQIDDQDRIDYVRRHLAQVHTAIADGVPIVGYLLWSLFDNFEWAWGYTGRFGIVEVDFETLERTPKASADWYAGVISSNTVEDPGPEPEPVGSNATA